MSQRHWSERAKERMRVLKLNQPALAKQLGLTQGAIGHYLRGRRNPSHVMLEKLADALQVDVLWLTQGIHPPPIPETVGERVAYARRRRDLTRWQLAKNLDCPIDTIERIEANQIPPPYPEALAAQLHVSAGWLMEGIPMAQDAGSISNVAPAPPMKRVPVLGWASAGHWREAIQQLPEDCDMIPIPGTFSGNCFGLRIEGDSMINPNPGNPSFLPGMVIVVDPDRRPEIGQYVVVIDNTNNEAIFKQYVRDSGITYLKPLNPQYPMMQLTDAHEICGVVVSAVQQFI